MTKPNRAPLLGLAAGLLAMGLVVAAWVSDAQPVTGEVLDRIDSRREGTCTVLTVWFTAPVQYVQHFPPREGRLLLIQVRTPLRLPGDARTPPAPESLVPPPDLGVPLQSVTYEPDLAGGPLLTLEFARPQWFAVGPGRDVRSLQVAVPDAPPAAGAIPCTPPSAH